MYRVMIGYLLVLFDIVFQIGNDGNKADLLPDFIGFILIFWGMWKFRKETDQFKKFVAALACAFLYSYVAYVLDMFGIMSKWPDIPVTLISVFSDMLKMVTVFLFIKCIKDMEKKHGNLQGTKMLLIWRVMMVCYLAEYVFLAVEEAEIAFFFFSRIAAFTYLFYIFTTANLLAIEKRRKKE